MEGKTRSKSESTFGKAHHYSMLRLRSLTKFNGVLQSIKPSSPKNIKNNNISIQRNNQKEHEKQSKNESGKLPPVRKVLKINSIKTVKTLVPEQGYVEFEVQDKIPNQYLHSTVSRDGAILTQNSIIEYLSLKQLQRRGRNIEKLKKIQTIKYLPILKPFLKWKTYFKIKRYNMLQKCLKIKLNISIYMEKSVIYHKVNTYFQKHIYCYLESILKQFKVLPVQFQQLKKPNLLRIFIKALEKSYENMKIDTNNKNTLNLLADFRTLAKISLYKYHEICGEYTLKLIDLAHQTIQRQFYDNRYSSMECKEILGGNKQRQPTNITTLVTLQMNQKYQIIGKATSQSSFNPYINCNKNFKEIAKLISEMVTRNQSAAEQIEKIQVKEIKDCLQNLKFERDITNKQIQNKINQLNQCFSEIVKLNLQDFQEFLHLLKSEIHKIIQIDVKAASKIAQVKDKLSQIQAFPQQIHFGMLTIEIKSLKIYLKTQIGQCWRLSCQKLPKDIEMILTQCEAQAQEMDNKILASVWTIKDIVIAYEENTKFSLWRENNSRKIENIQSMLEVINKINPRISQTFSIRYIKFKQKMKGIAAKSKAFERSLIERIKLVSNQKKIMIQELQAHVRDFGKKISQIRHTESNPTLHQNLQSDLKQFTLKIKQNLQHLTSFLNIEKCYSQSAKQTEFLYKITNLCDNYEKQIKFYISQLQNLENILRKLQNFVHQKGNQKISNIEKPIQLIQIIKDQIHKIKKNAQDLGLKINPLITSVIGKYSEQLQFFKSIQVLKKSTHLQNDFSKNIYKTVQELYDSQIHINLKGQIEKIADKLKIIENFTILQKQIQLKFYEHKILPSSQTSPSFTQYSNNQTQQFTSVEQAIDILKDAVEVQDNKIKTIGGNFDEEWKHILKDDYSKTIQNLKNNERAIQLLGRMLEIRKVYEKNKDLKYCKYNEIKQKVKDKWILLFNHYQQCSITDFVRRYKNFQKILGQIEEIQLQSEQKIQQMLTKTCSSFPLLYLYDQNIVFKAIADPIYFITYFFPNFQIEKDKQDEGYIIKSYFGEKLKIKAKQNEINLKFFFKEIEKQIKNHMVQLYQSTQNCVHYSPIALLEERHIGIPLQVMNFIDMLRIGQEDLSKRKQKNQADIEALTKYLTNLSKNQTIENAYLFRAASIFIMNRVQMRDLYLVNNPSILLPSYEYDESYSNFCLNICSFKVNLSYQLVPSEYNNAILSNNELYIISNIHLSFNNPQCTLLLAQNSLLYAYSFRVMRYLLNFPLLTSKFHSIIFAALKTKVMVTFEHREKLQNDILEKVNCELFKLYYDKYQKIKKASSLENKVVEWPIFVTLPQISDVYYREIRPQTRLFFRKIRVVTPHLNSFLEGISRIQVNSVFVSDLMKYKVCNQEFVKTNQYADIRKNILRFMRAYNRYNVSKLKPYLSLHLLEKAIITIIKYLELLSSCSSISYLKFNNLMKTQLISYLRGVNFYENQQQIPRQLLNVFQIKNCNYFKSGQSLSSQYMASIKYILNEEEEEKEQKRQKHEEKAQNSVNLQYHILKSEEIKEMLKNKTVAVLGKPGCGKTYFIENYLQTLTGGSQDKILKLHPTALGTKLWNEESSLLRYKKLITNKNYLIFGGSFSEENYPFFEKILQTKSLYYQSGEKISLPATTKIIFEVENTNTIDPYILVQLQWIYIKSEQIKWEHVLNNKIKQFKKLIIKTIEKNSSKSIPNATQIFINEIFNSIQNQIQDNFSQIISMETNKIFNQVFTWNMIITHTFKFLHLMVPMCLQLLEIPTKSTEIIKKLIKTIIELVIYCLYMVISLGNFKQCEKILQKIRNLRAQDSFASDRPQECLPKIIVVDEMKKLKFQPIEAYECCSHSLSSTLSLIPNRKLAIIGHYIKYLIQNKHNVMVIGKQCSGKTNFIKSLNRKKLFQPLQFKFAGAYESLIQRIKYKSDLKSTYGLAKQTEDKNVTFYIDDCALDLPTNQNIPTQLKYLWQTKYFLDQTTLRKQSGLNFLIEWNQHIPICPQFIHLFQINYPQQKNYQSIYNYLLQNHKQIYRENLQSIDQYEHTQLNLILLIVQNLKRVFESNKLQDWKHKYGCWNVQKAIDVYFRLKKNKRLTMLDLGNFEIGKDKIFKFISIFTIKLISLYLNKEELNTFQKFALKNNEKFEQYNNTFQKNQTYAQHIDKLIHLPKNVKENIYKIFQSIQMANFLIIQHKIYENIGSLVPYALKHNPNYKLLQSCKNVYNYQDFLSCIQQKYKNTSIQQNAFQKYIFYFSYESIKTNQYIILDYLNGISEEFQNNQQEINPLINWIFAIQYENDLKFVQKIQRCKKLLRKSVIINLSNQQQQQQIEGTLYKKYQSNLKSFTNGVQLYNKIFKIYKNITNKLSNYKYNYSNISRKQQIQQNINEYLLKSFNEMNIDLVIGQFIKIYIEEKNELDGKEILLRSSIEQINKIMGSYEEKYKRSSDLELKILFAEKELRKYQYNHTKLVQLKESLLKGYKNTNLLLKPQQIQHKNKHKHSRASSKQKKSLKRSFKHAITALNRTQVSQLKFVFINNKQVYNDLFQCICITFNGQYDANVLSKILMDVNLINRIREFKFHERTTDCLKLILDKIKDWFNKIEAKHILRNIVEWIHYGASLELYVRTETSKKNSVRMNNFNNNNIALQKQQCAQKEERQQKLDTQEDKNAQATQREQEQKEADYQEYTKLLQTTKQIQSTLQRIQYMEHELTYWGKQKNLIKNTLSKLQNFDVYEDIKSICKQQIERITQQRNQVPTKIIHSIFCFELLAGLSSTQLTKAQKIITETVKQNFEEMENYIMKVDSKIWQTLYRANLAQQQQEIIPMRAKSVKKTLKKYPSTSSQIPEQKIKRKYDENFKPTSHQLMKLYHFLRNAKLNKNTILINREELFTKLVTNLKGNFQPRSQQQHLHNILGYGIQVQEQQWTNIRKDLQEKNEKNHKGINDKFQFFISNNLGDIDRICKKERKLYKFNIVDFGVDAEDVKEMLKFMMYQLLCEDVELKGIKSYKRLQRFQTSSFYELLQQINTELPRLSLSQSTQINSLNLRIKGWLEPYLQSIREKDQRLVLIEAQLQSSLSQCYDIYEVYEHAHRLTLNQLSQNEKIQFKLINIPEKFVNILLKIYKQAAHSNSMKDTKSKIETIKNALIIKLLQTQISQNFKILYFLKIYSRKLGEHFEVKHAYNFIYEIPIEVKLKKTLNYRGIDPQMIFFQMIPYKNPLLEAQAKNLLNSLRKPEQNLKLKPNQKLTEEKLSDFIFKIKQLNFLQKLTLIKIFIPNSLYTILDTQMQKMITKLKNFHQTYLQNIQTDSNHNLFICLCDANLWRKYLSIGPQNYLMFSRKTLQIDTSLKFYCYSSLYKLPQVIFHGNSPRVILVLSKSEYETLVQEFNSRKIVFEYTSMQKILQKFWYELVISNDKYQLYQSLACQNMNSGCSFVQKYIAFKKFEQRITLLLQCYRNEGIPIDLDNTNFIPRSITLLQTQNDKQNKQSQSLINTVKKIYLELKKAEVQIHSQSSQTMGEKYGYIKYWMKSLESIANGTQTLNIKLLMEELRLKLLQTLAQSKNISLKSQQNLRSDILKLYQKLKQQYAILNQPHISLISRTNKLKEVSLLINDFYEYLYMYCRIRSCPILENILHKDEILLQERDFYGVENMSNRRI